MSQTTEIQFTIGDTFFNSSGTLLKIKDISQHKLEIKSENYSRTYFIDINKCSKHINSGFYKIKSIKSLDYPNTIYDDINHLSKKESKKVVKDIWLKHNSNPYTDLYDVGLSGLQVSDFKTNKKNKKEKINSFVIINKKGVFTVEDSSENQCYKEYHPLYNYEVRCIFKEDYDEQGFIIDHNDIHKSITSRIIEGSCEDMHTILHTIIKNHPTIKSKIIAFKTIIKPSGVDYSAHMEKIYMNDNIKNVISFISQL